jgi:hypothetical protein
MRAIRAVADRRFTPIHNMGSHMSVDKRRLAAAQRTAVSRRKPSRAKRLGAWIIIVPALSLFSFSVVAGAAGGKAKPDLESAAAKVVPSKHDEGIGKSHDQKQDGGALVVVDSSHGNSGISGLFGKGGREVCWISGSQLSRVSAVYKTTVSTLNVGDRTYTLVTVYEASEQTLKQLLGTPAVQCRLVHTAHLFFLPFDPNLS